MKIDKFRIQDELRNIESNLEEICRKMCDDAQLTVDDWNKSDDEFELHMYTNVNSCSISSSMNPDYYNLYVKTMEVK